MRHLSPNFCGISPVNFAASHPISREIYHTHPPSNLPNQMKDMAAKSCKRKVNTPGDLHCNVIAWLLQLELITAISWALENSSSIKLINPPLKISHLCCKRAPIYITFTYNHFLVLTEQAHVLWSLRGRLKPTKLKNAASLPPRQLSRNYLKSFIRRGGCICSDIARYWRYVKTNLCDVLTWISFITCITLKNVSRTVNMLEQGRPRLLVTILNN